MKRIALITGFIVMLSLSAFTAVYLTSWQVKENDYSVKFSTKGASGTLSGLKGTIAFDLTDLANSRFDVTVDVNTIDTGIGLKDKHAKAENFLDADNYPTIRFASSTITPSDGGFVATGQLTIKDVSKEVTIPFTFDEQGDEGVFRGTFELNRKDYNLEKNKIGEIIQVELVVPVNRL